MQGKVTTVEELVAELLSGHVPSWDLQGQLLHSRLINEHPGDSSFLVWRAKTTGCMIKQGAVCLPVGSVLLLEGRGVHFQDITFTGASCFGAILPSL